MKVAEKKFGIDKMVLKLLLVCLLNRIAIAEDSNATESKESIRFDDPNSVNPPTDRQGKFLSLASTGNTDILVKFTLPIISIPMEIKDPAIRTGLFMPPMIKVNARNILIFTLLALFSSVLYPIFENKLSGVTPYTLFTPPPPPEEIYNHPPPHWAESKTNKSSRSFTFDIYNWKDSLDKILFRDNSVTPCVQRIVCSAVVESKRANKPTNVDKIVDVMSSTMLFEQAINGTIVKDAVSRGREYDKPEECVAFYKDCNVDPAIINNLLKMVGV